MLVSTHGARRLEEAFGLTAGGLALLAIGIAGFVPVSGSSWTVRQGNRVIEQGHSTTSLFQFLGTGMAISVIATVVALAVSFAWIAVSHARERDAVWAKRWYILEWVVGVLLVASSFGPYGVFSVLFYPTIAFVAICLVFGATRHI